MAVVKRRIVWTTDEDWAALAAIAKDQDISISRFITGTLLAPTGPKKGRAATVAEVEAMIEKRLAAAR